MPAYKTINVSPDLHQLIQQLAKDEERSMNSIVRRAISSYTKSDPKPKQQKKFQPEALKQKIVETKPLLDPRYSDEYVPTPEEPWED